MPFNNMVNNLFKQQKLSASGIDYIVLPDDVIVNITSTTIPRTVVLPAPSNDNIGKFFLIKDASGGAGANSITIIPTSGTIDGGLNHVINQNYGSATFYSDGTNYSIDNETVVPIAASPLTDRGVIFADGTKLTQKNPNLIWNNATKRLGINTASPTGPFQVGPFLYTSNSSVSLTTTFQQFTPLNNIGFYMVNARHPNGDYFNFTCNVALKPGATFYLSMTGSADSVGAEVSKQGNIDQIDRISNTVYNARIQSTAEQIQLQRNNANGQFQMRRLGAGPVGAINFQVIKLGRNF